MKKSLLTSILMLATTFSLDVRPVFAADKTASPLDNLKFVPGDEDGNEKKALKTEVLVSLTEEKAIAQIQMLIRKYKGTQLEPDLQFRLAEMYMRRSKSDRFFELHREDEKHVKLAPRVVKKGGAAQVNLLKAVAIYEYLQKKFPHFAQMDLVIFNNAFTRQALGQEKEAEKLYWDLVKNFPESVLVPDAHLAIGEIAFQKAEFDKALAQFDAIRAFPDSRVYPYGLYKAAWTRYNMRDAVGGLKNLEEVVAFGNHVAEANLDAKLDLRKEAIGDMTLFFEDVFPSKEAYSYFRKQAGDKELPGALIKLSDLYERHARYQDERTVLQQFVNKLPEAESMPDAMNRIVVADDSMKQKDMAIADLEEFYKRCGKDSDFVKAHPKAQQSCQEGLQKTAALMAQKWLKIWNKNPYDNSFADMSEKAFEIYLRYKQTSEEYTKAHFLYAELLFKREKYRQASVEYAAVAKDDSKTQIGHDAAYASCLSLEKAVGDKWSDKDEKSFHELAQVYISNFPKGTYRLEIEFKMGFLAYDKGRYDEAAPIFLSIGQRFPRDEKGQKAQDLYLDILNLKKDYAGIRKYSAELIKRAPQERIANLSKIYEQAYFLEVQKIEETGDLLTALQGYQGFVKDNPTSDLAERAYWNMMQLHYKTGDGFSGAQASLEFAQRFPNSAQATPALAKAAQTLQQMAQLQPAANVLMQLSARDVASAAKLKELAADFYALSGHAQQARKLYQELLKSANKEDEKARLMAKMEIFEKNYGDDESHAAIVKQIVAKDAGALANQAHIKHLQNMWESGDMQATFQESKKFLGNSEFSAAEKAQIRFVQAQVLEDEFLKQSVKAKPERLAMVLSIKTEKLEKAQQAFQAVVRYGEPYMALKALEHESSCFAQYVKSLREIAPPEGLTEAEIKSFTKELQSLIIPLEEKGVDLLAQATAFAKKHRMLDGTVERLENELAKANGQAEPHHFNLTVPAMAVPVEEWSTL